MRFVPYEYQRYCTEYIKTHPIAALFLDMGLGKTVITLSAIKDLMLETFEVSKVLIIAPLRVARDTWPAEIEKWDHLKGLDISVIVGDVKTRIAAVHHPAMIYIVNRENIRWLVEYYEKNGMRWDFSMIVIDELSSFKNYQSQRFKFLRKVRPFVKRWVGLTGTPSSNGLMDLWAEIGILDGGERLGKFIGRYREAYFKAGALNPATGIVFQYVPRQGAEEMIYQRISDITISMKALDYLNMPDCVPTRCEVEMNTQERELYDSVHGRKIHVNKYINQCGKTKKCRKSAVSWRPASKETPFNDMPTYQWPTVRTPKQYEVWFAELGDHSGTSVQSGTRPVLVISNDVANRNSPVITVIPLSSKLKKLELPVHIVLTEKECEMLRDEHLEDSILLVEQITTIDKLVLFNRFCCVVSVQKKYEIEAAVTKQFAMRASTHGTNSTRKEV